MHTDWETKAVIVEVRAVDWYPESPPDRDTYVDEAKRILTPLLLEYNHKNGTRKRLLLSPLTPKLPIKVDHAFKMFTENANKELPHPTDWDRFYKFTIQCFMARRFVPPDPEKGLPSRNVGLCMTEEDIAVMLEQEKFQPDVARNLASIWLHCYEMLRFVRKP